MNCRALTRSLVFLALLVPLPALAQDLPHVRVVSPQMAELAETVRVSGSVVARDLVQVHARQSGLRVEELMAEEGDSVTAGQVLAVLDRTELITAQRRAAAGLEQARAAVDLAAEDAAIAGIDAAQAEREAERAGVLHQRNSFTTEALEQRMAARDRAASQLRLATAAHAAAQAAHSVARADLDAACDAVDHAQIRAPVAGLILSRHADRGDRADALFQIAAGGAMELAGTAPQADFLRLRPGMMAQVTLPGQAPVPGRVTRLSGSVDPATRLGEVRIALPDGAMAGAFAHATVTVTQVDGLVLPASSVVDGQVWVVRDGVVTSQAIAQRPAIGDLVPVAGLDPGDLVVLHHDSFVAEGMRIIPVETGFMPPPLLTTAEVTQ